MKRAMVRAAASVPPPGAKATIIVIWRSGRQPAPWARAIAGVAKAAAIRPRRDACMGVVPPGNCPSSCMSARARQGGPHVIQINAAADPCGYSYK